MKRIRTLLLLAGATSVAMTAGCPRSKKAEPAEVQLPWSDAAPPYEPDYPPEPGAPPEAAPAPSDSEAAPPSPGASSGSPPSDSSKSVGTGR